MSDQDREQGDNPTEAGAPVDTPAQPGTVASHPERVVQPFIVAPTTEKDFNTLSLDLVAVACLQLPDILFEFDSSFPNPGVAAMLTEVPPLRQKHKNTKGQLPPLSVFGHADPSGNDDYNKQLSGRRAMAIYGVLTRDVKLWDFLFDNPHGGDDWKSKSVLSTIRSALKESPGKPRKELVQAYMNLLSPEPLQKSDFIGQGGDAKGKADFQGCSEFNPLLLLSAKENETLPKAKRNEENVSNRRVIIFMFRAGMKVNPKLWPCPTALAGTADCFKRFFGPPKTGNERRKPGPERREFAKTLDTFACRFYDRVARLSPCELPRPPVPLEVVSPVIFFREAEPEAARTASKPAALVGSPGTSAVAAAPIAPATRVVVVKKPHTKAARIDVDLTTDKPFDGRGTFTVSPPDKIHFFLGAKKLEFKNGDNVFSADELRVGVTLFAEGAIASRDMNDVTLTLTLSGGSKRIGPPAQVKMTAVEVTLDICEPRETTAADPPALAQPPAAAPPASAKPKDKIFGGRGLPVQNEAKTSERAILLVRKIKPSTFTGNLVLTALSDNVRAFSTEVHRHAIDPSDNTPEEPLPKRHVFPAARTKDSDRKFFAEGVSISAKVRDSGFQLGIEGLQEDADRVAITVVHAEIVSDVEPKDVKTVALVPEKPERKSRQNKFFTAPIIIGVNYDVRLRPHTEIAQPDAVFDPLKFKWSSPAPGAQLTLADTSKEIVKLKAKTISAAQDDIKIDLIVDSDIGKFKVSHKLTIVNVEIEPVISGETPTVTGAAPSPINLIRNPSVIPILRGAAAADPQQAPKIEITKIEPNLSFTDDDPRIAWWIIGDEPTEAGKAKYEGKANFLNDESAKRGTKIQVVGENDLRPGDVLIQPWSGGFGYGMFRAHVAELRQIKYRVNRIFTNAVPAAGRRPAIPARVPTRSHADAKRHIAMANIYLRQVGIELIPDNSAEMASRTGNPKVGLADLDAHVVAVTQDSNGHFDVQVNDQRLTFRALDVNGTKAIRVNARNEIIAFAYLHTLASGNTALAQTHLHPANHAGRAFKDKGVPSSSLIQKTGIPGSTPVGQVSMLILAASGVNPLPTSPATRNINLLWGISVPTLSCDNFATESGLAADMIYGASLAHEVGHVLGLRHRIAAGDDFADGLTRPQQKNLMFPSLNVPTGENFDIIQAKAIRLSEVLRHNP